MSFIDQVISSDARRQSEYFQPGSYLVEIEDFKQGANRKGREFVVLETSVIDSDNLGLHPRGAKRSWLCMLDVDSTPRNIRGMLCAVLGVSNEGLTADMVSEALTPDEETGKSSLCGLRAYVHARNVPTKKGGTFTLLNFSAAADDASSLDGDM